MNYHIASGRRWMAYVRIGLAAVLLIPASIGCLPPSMANMQGARTMGEDESRIAAYAGKVGDPESDGDDVRSFGLLVGVGGRAETQFHIDRIEDFEGEGVTFLSFGSKLPVADDVCSVLLPLGTYWGALIESLQFDPTLFLTIPTGQFLEINMAGKLVLPLVKDIDKWAVVNLGVSLSPDVSKWAIMPELSYAVDLTQPEAGPLYSVGVAVSFY